MSQRPSFFLTIPTLLLALVVLTVAGAPTISAMPYGAGLGESVGSAFGPPEAEPGAGSAGPPGEEGLSGGGRPVPEDALEGYYVHVSTAEQLVRVYLDGTEIRTLVCSTGTADMPTPLGRFAIQNRGEWFFSAKYGQGARWWVSFRDWGIYLFHSVPIDDRGEVIPEEAAKLGQPASHGCVRLSMDDARWFYETIPEGTPVDID
ncbi:MAG: L,D-transpeptidase [Bacillota bacterium]